MPAHENEVLLSNLIAEIRSANQHIDERDTATRSRLAALESSVNDLFRKQGRPSGGFDADALDERKSAIGLLQQRHYNRQTKIDPAAPEPSFSGEDVAEAQLAIRGIRTLMQATSIESVPLDMRKALSSFTFGSQGFLLAPEMSSTILSCLEDATDVASLMQNISISSGSIKFLVDNEKWDLAGWACESSCFANNPSHHLGDGLGELEVKAESLRYVVCATKELLEDSGVAIEPWLLSKARRAFGAQIGHAIITGSGFGKPMGILNPNAGIPICETSDATPEGTFMWQDLVSLPYQIPQQFGDAGAYFMNLRTWALCSTMSDANGRPIMTISPTDATPFRIAGAPG